MKINSRMLSIPPYISTSWENVSSLQLEELTGNLIVMLKNSGRVSIPHLSGETIEEVFNAHSEFIEHQAKKPTTPPLSGFPITASLDTMQPLVQHDASQKDAPDLPPEILQKIINVTKAFGVDFEALHLPEGEPHCNCPYCQIARGIQGEAPPKKEMAEDEVSDEELTFREWDITQLDKQLYEVTNPLDSSEHYQVFLGSPIGCTCGSPNCEHIRAVLNS